MSSHLVFVRCSLYMPVTVGMASAPLPLARQPVTVGMASAPQLPVARRDAVRAHARTATPDGDRGRCTRTRAPLRALRANIRCNCSVHRQRTGRLRAARSAC